MRGLEDMSGMLTKFAIATTGVGINRMPSWKNTNPRDIRHQRTYTIDSVVSDITTLSSVPRPRVHDDFQEIADLEERKAFWAKLVVAWSLFVVFWLVGAALFVATEKWTFGVAAYFCFITFTTTGYGDFSPKTAAGRSVFVFWALLGLAAMTTMVSILQDAFSSKYKSAMHSGVFETAVKKYRQKTKGQGKKNAKEGISEERKIPDGIRPSAVEESSIRAQRDLESLPGKVLEQARVVHRYIHYLAQAEREGMVSTDLKVMLEDISRVQKLDEKVKDEIMQDRHARNTLCMLSIERALRELIDVAESVQSATAERDLMAVGYEEQREITAREHPENYASGSGTCHQDTHDSDAS